MTAAKKKSAPTYVLPIAVADVEKAIGIPAEEWKGRCFEIATKMVKAGLVEGEPIYGHWVGPISRSSHFAERRNTGFTNHGWVLVNEEKQLVVDPTRWVFEARNPYIFIGTPEVECPDFESEDPLDPVCLHCGHVEEEHKGGFFSPCTVCAWPYDEGGNKLRAERKREAPGFDAEGSVKKTYTFDKHLSGAGKQKLAVLLGEVGKDRPKGKLSWGQCMWLANLPYEDFDDKVVEFYDALKAVGLVALIPSDNRARAERAR
jgi:hypothetical protein